MNHMATHIRLLLCGLALLLLAQAAMAADLNGKWDFMFNTPVGERQFEITITDKDGNLTATMGETEFKGAFRDGKLELAGEHYADEAGYKAEFKIAGQIEGDQLKGDATWDTYDLTFIATRVK